MHILLVKKPPAFGPFCLYFLLIRAKIRFSPMPVARRLMLMDWLNSLDLSSWMECIMVHSSMGHPCTYSQVNSTGPDQAVSLELISSKRVLLVVKKDEWIMPDLMG
jgi:hypothetical protein